MTTASYQKHRKELYSAYDWGIFSESNFVNGNTITVGLDNHETVDFNVYPNPTSNIVNVECITKNEEWERMELHLCDAYGRLLDVVETRHGTSLQTAQIDLSRYANGVYFVKAVADGKTMAVLKVIRS